MNSCKVNRLADQFITISKDLIEDPTLSLTAKGLLVTMELMGNEDGLSLQKIVEITGSSRPTILNAIQELLEKDICLLVYNTAK